MSLLNFWTDQENALLCVDTLGSYAETGRTGHMSKAVVIPHLNAVLACRGDLALLYRLAARSAGATTIEQLVSEVPNLAEAAEQGQGASALGTEFALVGWSPMAGQMTSYRFLRPAPGARFASKVSFGSAAPSDGFAGFPEYPGMNGLKAFCRAQVAGWKRASRTADEVASGMVIGGNLVAFVLSREEVRVVQLGQFLD
jgi:hypothetical protein